MGDLVLVKLSTSNWHKGLQKNLIKKYGGPFFIGKKIGNVVYKVD